MKELSYLNKYLFKYKGTFFLGILFIILSNIFSVFSIIILRFSFDLVEENLTLFNLSNSTEIAELLKSDFTKSIFWYLVFFFSTVIISGIFLFYTRQTIIKMSRWIENDLKNEIYKHYQTLPLSFYRQNRTGDLMTRISEDVSNVRMYLGPAIMYGINMIALFAISIAFMLNVNIKLTIFTLLPLPVLSFAIYYVSHKMNVQSEIIQKSLSGMSNFVQEAFSGIRVLKSFVREQDSIKKFDAESENYKNQTLELIKINSYFVPLIFLLIGISTALTIYVGGIEVIKGNVTVGNIAEFVLYINKLTWPVASLGWITSLIQRAATSQQRINEFLNTKTDLISGESDENIKGDIEFVNVSHDFAQSKINALKSISFKIEKGQNVGILGTTGSGKSTIANAICRMFDPNSGQILIDGKNIRDFDLTHLRKNIGYVPQDVFLFSDTISENIAFGHSNPSKEEVENAAKNAGVYDNIINFPNGFETVVGERGITLSGGQKQRISIARAIIKNPQLLIFDDCLSAVDTKTEEEIIQNLKRLMKDKTAILIAHRISTVSWCDKIIMMDEGSIVEEGTHQELINRRGAYYDLWEKQSVLA